MVQDLIRSRPDVAEDVSALHCRGLCGDESVVAACRRLAFREGAASRGVSTVALCSLGTAEAVDALAGDPSGGCVPEASYGRWLCARLAS